MRSESLRDRAVEVIGSLRAASGPLTWVGLILLVDALACAAGIGLDGRTITGVPAWLKPAKFGASSGIYCLTMAWLLGRMAAVALGLAVRTGERSRILRILPLPIPAAVLFLPLIAEQATNGHLLAVLADPGLVADPAPQAGLLGLPDQVATVLQLAAGWPSWAVDAWTGLTAPLGFGTGLSAAFVWALGVPLLLLALIGLFWPKQSVPIRVGVFGVGGLLAAVLATRLQLVSSGGTPIPVWPGAGLSLAWLAVLEAAVCGLDRLAAAATLPGRGGDRHAPARVRAGGSAIVGFTAVVAMLTAVSPVLVGVLLGSAQVRSTGTATVPALVAAEGLATPELGMLTLTAQADGGYRSLLTRGQGRTLETLSTLQTTAGFGESGGLTRLAAGLVQPTGDDLSASLDAYRIGYVLLRSSPGATTAIAEARGALGANPILSVVSTTTAGTLYRFDDLKTTGSFRLLQAPSNTGSPVGVAVLLIQAIVFGLTALLALPTSRITQRFRPVQALHAPKADVRTTTAPVHPEPVMIRTPEQAMARELQSASSRQPEEVGSWR